MEKRLFLGIAALIIALSACGPAAPIPTATRAPLATAVSQPTSTLLPPTVWPTTPANTAVTPTATPPPEPSGPTPTVTLTPQPTALYIVIVLDSQPVRESGALSIREARKTDAGLVDRARIGEQLTVYQRVSEGDTTWLWVESPGGKRGWARENQGDILLVARSGQITPMPSNTPTPQLLATATSTGTPLKPPTVIAPAPTLPSPIKPPTVAPSPTSIK